jgi:hypothetical protein
VVQPETLLHCDTTRQPIAIVDTTAAAATTTNASETKRSSAPLAALDRKSSISSDSATSSTTVARLPVPWQSFIKRDLWSAKAAHGGAGATWSSLYKLYIDPNMLHADAYHCYRRLLFAVTTCSCIQIRRTLVILVLKNCMFDTLCTFISQRILLCSYDNE